MTDPLPDTERSVVGPVLDRLQRGDGSAREALVAIAMERMDVMAHRMLRRFPAVRRWEETDDVVQRAALKLHRALGAVVPEDHRRLLGLAAVQIRRTLLDLARMYSAPNSFASNQSMTEICVVEQRVGRGEPNEEGCTESPAHLERWTHFHEVAAGLPDEERQLFDLVWYMGLQQNDVACVLGCSIRTLKRRWEKVKALLRERSGGKSPLEMDEER